MYIALKNPFRYRSYYYDFETGLYYLNSRYYDPETGRFINIDELTVLDVTNIALNGINLYAYCLNNPVNEVDESGYFIWVLFGIAVAAIAGYVIGQAVGSQAAGGISSIVNGGTAIATGISLFSFGPVGWILGGIAILAGIVSIAFGTAEIQEAATGNNWIKSTGISTNAYNTIYITANVVATIASIAGNVFRASKITTGTSQAPKTPQTPYSRYYQLTNNNAIKSVTQFNKSGLPKYRIDVLGRAHNNLLPHKHIFSWNNSGQPTGEKVVKIKWLLWLIWGNWR